MSQYPPNPNNNPYGQNPPDPNQGTAYGSPPPGPGQNPYNPYPNNPGTNPNPYGPYSPNPAQPNSPSTGPGSNPDYGSYNPYAPNPPTPGPATNPNYNPYDPYGQTARETAPSYNPYQAPMPPAPPPGTFQPAPSQPPVKPRGGLSTRVIILAAVALILVVGGIVFGLVAYKNGQNGYANATATAQAANANATATAQANATATAQAALTATAIASTYPFSANQVLSDPLSDNSKNNGWETSQFCKFQGSAYHTVDPQTNTFTSCSAVNTDYTNFTFEVEASLVNGDGLGITFRGNAAKTQFYRAAIYNDGSYGVYVYVDPTAGNTRTLKTGNLAQTPTLSNTNTIAVVARGTTMTLYFNQTEVVSFTDSTYTHGQIGVATTDLSKSADAVFSNAKVWGLP